MKAFRKLKNSAGQGTVEYAIVLAAFLAIVVGLGAISHVFTNGSVSNHALFSASHHANGNALTAISDVFSF